MMSSVFLSHAVADSNLAYLLIDLLTDAMGVPTEQIFCSSHPGLGIPMTDDFEETIRTRLLNSELVILLMTPSYMDSQFCLMELGAAWAQCLPILRIVVPPISFHDVTGTLGSKQSWRIDEINNLQSVRDKISSLLNVRAVNNNTFDRKRESWDTDLSHALEALALSPKVSRVEFEALRDKLQSQIHTANQELLSCQAHLEEQTVLSRRLEREVTELKALRPVALVIEGEPLIAADLTSLIEKQGLVVSVARTQSEAMEMVRTIRPDVITSETILADGSSGITAVGNLLRIVDAQAIFITAYPETLIQNEIEYDFALITKPFDPSRVASSISLAIHQKKFPK